MPDLSRYSFSACVKAEQEMKIGSWEDEDVLWGGVSVNGTEGIVVTDHFDGYKFFVDCSSCENDESIINAIKEAISDYEARRGRAEICITAAMDLILSDD